MTAQRVIIDCDPGQDDAVNLFLALASPDEVEILGITTVAGNVPVALTQRNARMVCEVAGRADVPVYAGCSRPLLIAPVTAEHVHGETGIDGLAVFAPQVPVQNGHAVDFITATLIASPPRSVTIIATAALTNIALALMKEPRIADAIDRVILMGGAMREAGNITPSAEFNIRVDPHAAQLVFKSGLPIVALSLDVTHRLLVTPAWLDRIGLIGNPVAKAVQSMLGFSGRFDREKYGSDGAPLHDPCTMAYVLAPELFQTKRCSVEVETTSAITIGHTSVDFWHVRDDSRAVEWAYGIDAASVLDLIEAKIRSYS